MGSKRAFRGIYLNPMLVQSKGQHGYNKNMKEKKKFWII
jgi:hypothetical protein